MCSAMLYLRSQGMMVASIYFNIDIHGIEVSATEVSSFLDFCKSVYVSKFSRNSPNLVLTVQMTLTHI
jgi:hypothetical protein